MSIEVTSPAFENGYSIPSRYTADGVDISPPLHLDNLPEGTVSIAVICDDPDAPMATWVHWLIYNLPGDVQDIAENYPHYEVLDNGAKQGMSDFGVIGYEGPAPPNGKHRYFFKVYALDSMLDIPAGITKFQLEKAMEGHILARGQLMGKYSRV